MQREMERDMRDGERYDRWREREMRDAERDGERYERWREI